MMNWGSALVNWFDCFMNMTTAGLFAFDSIVLSREWLLDPVSPLTQSSLVLARLLVVLRVLAALQSWDPTAVSCLASLPGSILKMFDQDRLRAPCLLLVRSPRHTLLLLDLLHHSHTRSGPCRQDSFRLHDRCRRDP